MAGSLALSWSCFSEYQKSCHVLLLAQVVHFEVDSTTSLPVSVPLLPRRSAKIEKGISMPVLCGGLFF